MSSCDVVGGVVHVVVVVAVGDGGGVASPMPPSIGQVVWNLSASSPRSLILIVEVLQFE